MPAIIPIPAITDNCSRLLCDRRRCGQGACDRGLACGVDAFTVLREGTNGFR